MKLLLLTDIMPSSDYTAGLVLAKLCRFIPHGGISCFTVLNRHLDPKLYADLDWMPLAVAQKPIEMGQLSDAKPYRSRLRNIAAETYRRFKYNPRLVAEAVSFGKQQGATAVLAVLQGQTMVRMAEPVARGLGADLYTLVWDPLSWWLRDHKVDRFNRAHAQKTFSKAMRASKACATASWAMADHYQQKYGVRSVPVIASHNQEAVGPPATGFRKRGEMVIGMAGQFYSSEEWWQLVTALNHAGWMVGDRKVRLRVFSRDRPAGPIPPDRLDFMGFAPQDEVIRSLTNDVDVLYCPYPFRKEMEEVSRLSFPGKLAMYLGCGRPVVFHGPAYSSPYQYLKSRDAGVLCSSLDPPAIYNSLCWLNEDPALYAKAAAAGMAAFRSDFTLEAMRASFFNFLGVGPEAFDQSPPKPNLPNARHAPALLTGLQKQKRALQSVVEAANQAWVNNKVLESRLNQADWRLTHVVSQNISLQTRIERDANQIDSVKADLAGARKAIFNAEERGTAYLARISEMERRNAELGCKLIESSERISSLNQHQAGVLTRAEVAESELESLAASHTELQNGFAELRGVLGLEPPPEFIDRTSIRDALTEASQIILAGRLASRAAERSKADLERALGRVSAEIATREDVVEKLRQSEAELQREQMSRVQTATQLRSLKTEIAALKNSLEESTALQSSLQRNLDLAIADITQKDGALRDWEIRISETERIRASLQANLDLSIADIQQKDVQLKQYEARILDSEARTQESLALQASLQRNLDLTIIDRDGLNAQLAVLREAQSHLVEDKTRLQGMTEIQLAGLLGKLSMLEHGIEKHSLAAMDGPSGGDPVLRTRYLDLLEAGLTGTINEDGTISPWSKGYDPLVRSIGRDWPKSAVTMIGVSRMRNIRHMVETVLNDGVPGDLLEAGVWRGGACIYMRGILEAYQDKNRHVWVADSFEGLPPPEPDKYPADAGDVHYTVDPLRVTLEDVQDNFRRFGLLDRRVKFLKGWFEDTLHAAPIEKLAVLRLDGDMYSSTIQTLEALYHKVAPGGAIIVDDYILPGCREAVDYFRRQHSISAPLVEVDGAAVYWRVPVKTDSVEKRPTARKGAEKQSTRKAPVRSSPRRAAE